MKKRSLLLTAALLLVLTACTRSSEPQTTSAPATTTTQQPTTTTAAPAASTSTVAPESSTTTTTEPPVEIFETINGTEVQSDAAPGVIAIKIDNHPNARPHSGLQYADVVYEVLVEAGLTRFIALYETQDSEKVGPVRSLRITDMAIINPIDVPLQISGGSLWILRDVRKSGTKLLIDAKHGTYRDKARKAPHNLYADTAQVKEFADSVWGPTTPGNLFPFGDAPELVDDATRIVMTFSKQPPSVWDWDAESQQYLHSYADTPHTTFDAEGNEEQVSAKTLVVIRAKTYTAAPESVAAGKAVPASLLTDGGDAQIMYGGKIDTVRWVRDNVDDAITLVNVDGTPVIMPPGVVWVSVVPTNQSVEWD